jgi:hypothetical protein
LNYASQAPSTPDCVLTSCGPAAPRFKPTACAALNQVMIDGIDATEMISQTFVVRPTVEGIQEFKVLTNNAGAEFGRFYIGLCVQLAWKVSLAVVPGSRDWS